MLSFTVLCANRNPVVRNALSHEVATPSDFHRKACCPVRNAIKHHSAVSTAILPWGPRPRSNPPVCTKQFEQHDAQVVCFPSRSVGKHHRAVTVTAIRRRGHSPKNNPPACTKREGHHSAKTSALSPEVCFPMVWHEVQRGPPKEKRHMDCPSPGLRPTHSPEESNPPMHRAARRQTHRTAANL